MKIVITDEAFKWFKEEMEVASGDYVRFYARYGGSSPFHEAFSLGMNREIPHEIGVETIVNDVHFYIEKADECKKVLKGIEEDKLIERKLFEISEMFDKTK